MRLDLRIADDDPLAEALRALPPGLRARRARAALEAAFLAGRQTGGGADRCGAALERVAAALERLAASRPAPPEGAAPADETATAAVRRGLAAFGAFDPADPAGAGKE